MSHAYGCRGIRDPGHDGERPTICGPSHLRRVGIGTDPDPIPHTTLGQTADLIVVAPATARCIGSYANGISDDLLTATLIATKAPVVVCPAMHTEMWEHPAVQDNLTTLEARGVHLVAPDEGRLAGGDSGTGRLAAPEVIYEAIEAVLSGGDFQGRTVVVTAGGTREAIDPVRYVGNRSTGKQGYAIAEAASARGAHVTLISTVSAASPSGVEVVRVESAAQMHAAVLERSDADVIVMTAAVADFRPVGVAESKIKKDTGPPKLELESTPDILAELGAEKKAGQVIVGFAAETEDLVSHAQSKLERKNVDVIVANDVSAPQVGFAHDTNEVTIFVSDGCQRHVSLRSKRQIAEEVLNTVAQILVG